LLKPTTTGLWAHLSCALWVPESHVKDPLKMEPIVAKLTKQRQALRCVVCDERGSGCIQWCGAPMASMGPCVAEFSTD
jgi:hypothetical protein